MSIEWDIKLNFDAVNADVHERFPRAILTGLEHVRSVSAPLVPVLTGQLVGSADVKLVDNNLGTITYPGPYALYQHEGVYYRHGVTGAPLRHSHGQSFFLQQPMITEAQKVVDLMADVILGNR